MVFNNSIKILIQSLVEGYFFMRVFLQKEGPYISIITIENPGKLNAMTRSMMKDLGYLWDELGKDDTRCVIITGAGNRAFCVGADISGDLEATPDLAKTVNHSLLKTDVFNKPVIAAVNGDCVGGGIELLLSTDIRCAPLTARFGLPEVKWSIYPFGGATTKLIQQIGYVHAMDLLLTGRLITAKEAKKINLINAIVDPGSALDWAIDRARIIALNSPSAAQAVKTQISATIAEHTLSREDIDQTLGDQVRANLNFKEGVAAFLEKRRPNY
jgi:enoyl-CoA hydratase